MHLVRTQHAPRGRRWHYDITVTEPGPGPGSMWHWRESDHTTALATASAHTSGPVAATVFTQPDDIQQIRTGTRLRAIDIDGTVITIRPTLI